MSALSALYRLVLGLWVGGIAVFTFLVTPIVFRSFGRDEAGRIVGRLFPAYFPYLLTLSLLALALFLFSVRGGWRPLQWACLALLLLAVAANSWSRFWYYPRARALTEEIGSFEATPPDHPLRRQFARLHGASMALNLVVLADGAVLLLLAAGTRR